MEIRRIYDTIPFIYGRHRTKELWEQEIYGYGVGESCIHTTPRLIFLYHQKYRYGTWDHKKVA